MIKSCGIHELTINSILTLLFLTQTHLSKRRSLKIMATTSPQEWPSPWQPLFPASCVYSLWHSKTK